MAAGCTTWARNRSVAGMIGQASVCVEVTATPPPRKALTRTGLFMPQVPGPLIGVERRDM